MPDDEIPRPPRPPGTFRIGRLAGVEVHLKTSWFLLAVVIAVLAAPVVEHEVPGIGLWSYVVGLLLAVGYALTILFHEAAHAVLSRHYGHPAESITLHFLGGHTGVDGAPRNPREEFVMSVVGPLASLLVALVAWLLLAVMPDGVPTLLMRWLAVGNLVLGLFNLIPGLPLDGGRVLKAVVWGITRNEHRGTIVAGWAGRVVAVLVLLLPLALQAIYRSGPLYTSWLFSIMLAIFIWMGATAAMQGARIRSRLPGIVGRKLARRAVTVAADLPLAQAIERARAAEAGGIVTVDGAGRPVGVVNEAALNATPDERRPWVSVATVARGLVPGMMLPAEIAGEELIRAITFLPAQEYVLVEPDGSLYGILATADVDRAFRERRR